MLTQKLLKTLVPATLLACLALANQTTAQESYTTLLCPQGCGPMEGDNVLMNQMIQADAPVVLQPQESPGYLANIRMMQDSERWKTTIFATEDPIIQLAPLGGTGTIKEFLPESIDPNFKLLYGEAWWAQGKFFVTFDDELETIEDLKGKDLALGLRSQSDWGFFSRLFLEHGFDITPDNTAINHMTPGQLTQRLIDGNADAAVSVFAAEPKLKDWIIGGPLRQLEAAGDINYIGIEPEKIEEINDKFGTTFLHVNVPAGTLPSQKQDLSVAINRGYKAVHETFSEEAAYKIVKAVLDIGEEMRELHPLWSIWSPDLMVHGLSPDNTHPGAIKAYKEAGVWNKAVDRYEAFQVAFPE